MQIDRQKHEKDSDVSSNNAQNYKRDNRKRKNYALMILVVFMIVLIYATTIIKLSD